ncbi:hypothetical protein K0M31_000486 [Melipona bicolor]|uniref:Uncharacterized protein n=1 Tax=Melipona bicolor TaxID=60889 RepID=A0AA40GDU7_9HYME|nr:hypothetical protein K0M31_000486 [Melipona bicolor]
MALALPSAATLTHNAPKDESHVAPERDVPTEGSQGLPIKYKDDRSKFLDNVSSCHRLRFPVSCSSWQSNGEKRRSAFIFYESNWNRKAIITAA